MTRFVLLASVHPGMPCLQAKPRVSFNRDKAIREEDRIAEISVDRALSRLSLASFKWVIQTRCSRQGTLITLGTPDA